MTNESNDTCTVVVEREFPHPPERVWRALTQPELIADWLMQSDFRAETGHRFRFTAAWGEIDCRVLEVEHHRTLAYTWEAHGVETIVTFTLETTERGTRLRMEQAGFRPDQKRAVAGATGGWSGFLDKLQTTLSTM
jgi:uncharacterized protein YndB with AHSA1/START domain